MESGSFKKKPNEKKTALRLNIFRTSFALLLHLLLFLPCLQLCAQTYDPSPGSVDSEFLVKRIALPLVDGAAPPTDVSLYVCNDVVDPQAVLVVCINASSLVSLEKETKDSEWKTFAETHNLGLIVMIFGYDYMADRLMKGYEAGPWAGKWLLQSAEHFYGPNIQLLIHGEQRGGTFAASFVNWKPELVKAWSGYTNQWLEKPKQINKHPPGIVAYDSDDHLAADEFGGEWYFKNGRKVEQRLLEVKLTPPLNRRKKLIGVFARQFFQTILTNDTLANSAWVDQKSGKPAGLELMRNPAGVSWIPDRSLINDWTSLINHSITDADSEMPPIIEHTVITNNPLQPELRMFLRLPIGSGNRRVDGVLAFCSWEGEREAILKKLNPGQFERIAIGNTAGLKDLFTQLTDFAEKHNLAMLTWETQQVWSIKPSYYSERETEDREANFDLMASAWVAGVDALARKADIPDSGYFMFGISRGAQWAHRLALRKPERFIAVQFHVASTFDIPTPEGSRLLWLVSTGDEEVGYRNGDAKRFYDQCRELDYPVIFKSSRGLGHDDNLEISRLREAFFEYAISVRNRMISQEIDTPSDIAKPDLENAKWIGNYATGAVTLAKSIDDIPIPHRVPLPTPELVQAWSGRPAPEDGQ